VLHALPAGPHATREPLQFGAEIYGHAGLEADLEVLDLGLDCLRRAGLARVVLDLGDSRVVRGLLSGVVADAERLGKVYAALAAKDAASLREITRDFPVDSRDALQALITLYGDAKVLDLARRMLPQRPLVLAALDDLDWLAQRVMQSHPEVRVGFDLADIGGNEYYSGARFAAYAAGTSDAVARGGRYDEVGAVFGRNRPAVGFSLDLKALAAIAPTRPLHAAIRAPWAEDAALRSRVRGLREQGETVVRVLPGHEHEAQEYDCDRELAMHGGVWTVRSL
jgi:ATP phosphoribosyltransferase regulatory subunit